MKTYFFIKRKTWLLAIFLFFLMGAIEAKADIYLTEDLTLSGWLRHSMAFNMGVLNPYNKSAGLQTDNNTLNLSRSHLQAELTYTPTDLFRAHTKIRVVYDQTTMWDDDLHSYDPFPLPDGKRYGGYLRTGEDDRVIAEIWEIYADLYLEKLWLRLGKQVISWGEMIGIQVMDIINPLDLTWHNIYEIEEYENIKIPLWMIRGRYEIRTGVTWLTELFVEGFWNPGDTSPEWAPEPGSAYHRTFSTSGLEDVDYTRRGDDEFGIRIGGRFAQFGWSLNYLYLYTDSSQLNFNAHKKK